MLESVMRLVVLQDERIILPAGEAAVEVRGGQPPATTALGLQIRISIYSQPAS
jgi:hypothetical protein